MTHSLCVYVQLNFIMVVWLWQPRYCHLHSGGWRRSLGPPSAFWEIGFYSMPCLQLTKTRVSYIAIQGPEWSYQHSILNLQLVTLCLHFLLFFVAILCILNRWRTRCNSGQIRRYETRNGLTIYAKFLTIYAKIYLGCLQNSYSFMLNMYYFYVVILATFVKTKQVVNTP